MRAAGPPADGVRRPRTGGGTVKTIKRQFRVHLVYNRDDGGWYAEIYHSETGRELWTSRVYKTEAAAKRAVYRWLAAH